MRIYHCEYSDLNKQFWKIIYITYYSNTKKLAGNYFTKKKYHN